MGLFGFALFVEAMGFGFSMLSGALALSFLMLPIIMRTTEEAIRAVPRYIRWGSYGLGATKWQTVRASCFRRPRRASSPGSSSPRDARWARRRSSSTRWAMINQAEVARSRAASAMTVHLYRLAMEGINLPAAYGTALVLMIMILAFNLTARWILKRYRKV